MHWLPLNEKPKNNPGGYSPDRHILLIGSVASLLPIPFLSSMELRSMLYLDSSDHYAPRPLSRESESICCVHTSSILLLFLPQVDHFFSVGQWENLMMWWMLEQE